MKKQTAVEWFQSQIINIVNGNCELSEIEIFEKAKEMEKSQILDAYVYGSAYGTDPKQGFSALNYFESTYKKS